MCIPNTHVIFIWKIRNKNMLTEVRGDLFSSSDSLCHCVSADLIMGRGIAVEFKRRFGRVSELKAQNPQVGNLVYLSENGRQIFYLVTKEKANFKPSYANLERSLFALRNKCVELGVRRLSMPRIACGLDGKDWNTVKEMIKSCFDEVGIEVTVYVL